MKRCPVCDQPNEETAIICKTDWCLYNFEDKYEDPGGPEFPPDAGHLFKQGDIIAEKYLIERILGKVGMGSVYFVNPLTVDISPTFLTSGPIEKGRES